MPVNIKVDKNELASLTEAVNLLVKAVEKGALDAVEKQAKDFQAKFRDSLDTNNVPGPALSPKWVRRKQSLGLKTTKLQRFGRGDSRSYYENVVAREMKGRGWFVGVLTGTNAYTIEGNLNPNFEMHDIAKLLEERFPLWNEIFNRGKRTLPRFLLSNIRREMMKLGFDVFTEAN